jgi:hypothetical protein
MRSWPALYELMPGPQSVWMTKGNPAAFYAPETFNGSPLRPVPAYQAAALASWGQLAPVPDNYDWTDVCGITRPTASGILPERDIVRPGSVEFSDLGDGTVALGSAHEGNRRVILTPCQHDLLCADARVWPYMHLALLGQLAQDVTIRGRTLQLQLP